MVADCCPDLPKFEEEIEINAGNEYEMPPDVVPSLRPVVKMTRWLALLPDALVHVILVVEDQVLASHKVDPIRLEGL